MKRFGLGFVFFVALVLLGFGTLLIGDLRDVFGPKTHLRIHFERVQGLREGDDVRVDGFLGGKVKKIQLLPTEELPGTGVLVTVRIKDRIVLFEDSEITVESSSVLGGSQVAIHRGTRGRPLDTGQILSGKTQPGLETVGKLVDENKENVHAVIANLKELTEALKNPKSTFGKFTTTDELHKKVTDAVDKFGDLAADAKTELKKVGDGVNKLVEKVDKGEGPVAHLLNDKKMSEDLQKTLDNVKGTSENLKKITDKLDSNKTVAGKLLSDEEMGEKFKRTLDNVEQFSESLKNVGGKLDRGEGSVGKLLQDDELYEKAKRTMDDIDRVFAKAARSVVEVVAEEEYFPKSQLTETKLGIRITPGEDKFIYVGASVLGLNKDGDILFRRQIEEDQNDTIVKADIQLGYRVPWFLDHRLTVRGGMLEGKPGGGVDFRWDDWGFFSHPVQLSIEGRQAYNDVDRGKIDEQIPSLWRAYVKTPLWTRRDNWFELLLSSIHLYAGVNRIGSHREELLAGFGLEWPDDDIRMLVGFIGLAR
jgi:phospholipid/cholesterol/gamma-HCH transport system substrate-binding protein